MAAKKLSASRGRDKGSNKTASKTPIQERKVERRKIADLKQHPKQATHFRDLPLVKLQRMAKGMLTRGLKIPVEITRDNVIVCGHQRVRAARLNGWTEIDVIVRDDLLDDATIEAELLRDNRERRQLSRLQEVRCLKGEWDLAQARPCHERSEYLQGTLKEAVSAELDMSPKNSQRYLDLLKTPNAVQDAFDDGDLPLNTAARVAGLPEDQQEEIAQEIDAGKDAKAVVEQYLGNTPRRRQRIHPVLRMSMRHFFQAVRMLQGRASEIEERHLTGNDVALLNQVQSLAGQMLQAKATSSTANAAAGQKTTTAR